jgi:hypothetical protein
MRAASKSGLGSSLSPTLAIHSCAVSFLDSGREAFETGVHDAKALTRLNRFRDGLSQFFKGDGAHEGYMLKRLKFSKHRFEAIRA